MIKWRKPFIVAEISANHGGSLSRAIDLVNAAADAGADAVKLQTWTPGMMCIARDYDLKSGHWAGRNLADLYEEAHTPWGWHQPLFDAARKRALTAFSSVFDALALEFLESIECPMYKISSFELVDLELIAAVAQAGKPMIMSTGMATSEEIDEAVKAARENGAKDLTLLHCVSAYPTNPKEVNLARMVAIQAQWNCFNGFSDHTPGTGAAAAAAALGAFMIEKHITLPGHTLDEDFSLVPVEFEKMVKQCREAAMYYGSPRPWYGPIKDEEPQLDLRRSLYFMRSLKKGETITRSAIVTARPAMGLAPRLIDDIIGYCVAVNVKSGQPVTRDVLTAPCPQQPSENQP